MKRKQHFSAEKVLWLAVMLHFTCCHITVAAPVQLRIFPKGTNQVEMRIGPVVPGVYYEVLARTNGPEGHWITFAGYIGDSNKTICRVEFENDLQLDIRCRLLGGHRRWWDTIFIQRAGFTQRPI